jgi:pseudaminic acid biosynthesis-associated methylase
VKDVFTDSITELERFREMGETRAQERFWMGEFGASYTDRNRVRWLERVPFWHEIITKTSATSAYEVGCNAGWNLLALRTIYPGMFLRGIDVNERAVKHATACGLVVENAAFLDRTKYENFMGNFDLVFTSGVLIHVPPEDLKPTMEGIIELSNRYVLAVEYADDEEKEIEYRGHKGRLWRRPIGKMYEGLGLRQVDGGTLTKEFGFDNCMWWLMSR